MAINNFDLVKTFEDLHNFLKSLPSEYSSFREFLEANDATRENDSGYRQEALLILFASFGMIQLLIEFIPAAGNFSKGTCCPAKNKSELFVNKNGTIKNFRGNGGDASDFTAYSEDQSVILAITSKSHKNNKTQTVKSLELDEIKNKKNEHYPNKTLRFGICVRDRVHAEKMNPQGCNEDIRPYLKNAIIVDWQTLFEAFLLYKSNFQTVSFDEMLGIDITQKPHVARFYQKSAPKKFLSMINTVGAAGAVISALLAFLPRTGKTSVIVETIIQDNQHNGSYLIVTPCPNETISGYFKLLRCSQLRNYNIQHISGDNLHPIIGNQNVFIASKQFLQSKVDEGKHLDCLLNTNVRIAFVDEAHLGCTTDIMKKIFDFYCPRAHRLFVTATYGKPASVFNIPTTRQFNWDLEDIMLCKNIHAVGIRKKLIEKHGSEFGEILEKYTDEQIQREIGYFPELEYLTQKLDESVYKQLSDMTADNKYGWSTDALFNGNWNLRTLSENDIPVFQNEEAVLKTLYTIFGKSSFGIPDSEYNEEKVFIERVNRICRMSGQQELCKDSTNPTVVLAFLPPNNINYTSIALKMLVEKHNILPDYQVVITNTAASSQDAKTRVNEAIAKAKNTEKKGVLVLTGTQLHLGVTIDECDLVLLLNSSSSYDKVFQMIFRCMTPRLGKKRGFVVDLNIQRAISTTFAQYASTVRPGTSLKKSIRYLVENKLISLNSDHWLPSFGNAQDALVDMCSTVYRLFAKDCKYAIKNQLQTLLDARIELSAEEQATMHSFKYGFVSKENTKQTAKLNENQQELQNGLDRTRLSNNDDSAATDEQTSVEEEKDETPINSLSIEEFMFHISPLLCLFTIHEVCDTVQGMFSAILNNESLKNCMMSQVNLWWGNEKNVISLEQVKEIVYLYSTKMDNNMNEIIANIKQLFREYRNNVSELSELVDTYFVPKEIEKARNAEISTPFKLRKEMLDVIHHSFWNNPNNKVLEPCAGKCQFIIDIINRFMKGLSDVIPDDEERYKHIVENCIYFADINPTNIFICTLLIDPENQYKLNYQTGDTLSMNIKDEVGVDEFDLTVMNPPYNEDPANSADPHKKPLYQNWISHFSKISKQLLAITPSKWFTSDDKPLKILRDYMKQQPVVTMQHFPNDDVFHGVSIKGGVSYFHIDNRIQVENNFTTRFNGTDVRLTDFEIILSDPRFAELVLHMKPFFDDKALSSEYVTQGRYVDSDKLLAKQKNNDTDVVCYVSQNKGFRQFCPLNSINKNAQYDTWKVITTAAAHNGSSGFGNMFVGKPNELHSKSYVSFNTVNEETAKSLESYLKCKLPQVLLSLRKITHNLTNKNVFAWIPYPPLDRLWTNKTICEFYKLSDNLIDILKNHDMEGNYSNEF